MGDQIWTGTVDLALTWGTDDFGRVNQALFLNSLFVGGVFHAKAKDFDKWRAYITSVDDELKDCACEQAARDWLVDKVIAALDGAAGGAG